jgi:hypothetical protein
MHTTLFHVTIDDSRRAFWLDGGINIMRLHYEIMRQARNTSAKLREHDVFAQSEEDALAEVRRSLSGYEHLGAWPTKLPA